MLLGGLAGFGFAISLVELFNRASTLALPDFSQVRLSLAVILTALGVLCLVVLVAALAPVVRARRLDLHAALQTGSKGTSAAGSERARHLLIAAEVALATALLVGTGLTARSLFQMTKMNTGYNPHRLLTFRLQLDRARLPTREQRIDFTRRLAAAFQNGPGLEATTLWGPSMLSHAGWTLNVTPAGRDLSDPASALNVQLLQTIPGGMASLGISLLRGRDFSNSPSSEYPLEAIIDEEAARRLWPGLDPIGQTMFLSNDRGRPATVIGLAPHVLNRGRTFNDSKYLTGDIYLSFYQMAQERITVVMRYRAGQEESILRWTRVELARLGAGLAPFDVATMDERMTRESRGPRFTATVFAVYSAVALLVTVVGVYGVLAFSTGQRRREFGLRFAVGASRGQVIRLVLRQSVKWISIGTVIGLIIALQCVPLLDQLLIGVSPRDPFVLIGTVSVILAAGLLATLVPALRAAHVDPIIALRTE
jgi:putative ABC transport system permease protein